MEDKEKNTKQTEDIDTIIADNFFIARDAVKEMNEDKDNG